MVDQLAIDRRPARRLAERHALRGLRRGGQRRRDPHAMFEYSPFIGRANPLAPPHPAPGGRRPRRGQVVLRLGLRGPTRVRARRLHRRRVRRGARRHPVAVGCPGHDRPAHGELPEPHALLQRPAHRGRLDRRRGPQDLHRRRLYATGRRLERLCAEAEGLFISMTSAASLELKAQREQLERDRLEDPTGLTRDRPGDEVASGRWRRGGVRRGRARRRRAPGGPTRAPSRPFRRRGARGPSARPRAVGCCPTRSRRTTYTPSQVEPVGVVVGQQLGGGPSSVEVERQLLDPLSALGSMKVSAALGRSPV